MRSLDDAVTHIQTVGTELGAVHGAAMAPENGPFRVRQKRSRSARFHRVKQSAATDRPGLKATTVSSSVCPFSVTTFASVRGRPNSGGVVERARDDQPTVRAEGRCRDAILMPDESLEFSPACLQEMGRIVFPGSEDETTVGAKNGLWQLAACIDGGQLGAARRVPQLRGTVDRCGNQPICRRDETGPGSVRHRDRNWAISIPGHIPDSDLARKRCRRDAVSIGTERRALNDLMGIEPDYLTSAHNIPQMRRAVAATGQQMDIVGTEDRETSADIHEGAWSLGRRRHPIAERCHRAKQLEECCCQPG